MNKQQFSGFRELSVAQMRLLKAQGVTLDKIAAMFSVPVDTLSFLEDVEASQGKPENLRRRMLSKVVTK